MSFFEPHTIIVLLSKVELEVIFTLDHMKKEVDTKKSLGIQRAKGRHAMRRDCIIKTEKERVWQVF